MNMENFSINFTVTKEGVLFSVKKEDLLVMNCSLENNVLDFSLLYDFKTERPLHLRGSAKVGDNAKINVMPHRIELFIGGVLTDEEWPCGNHFLTDGDITSPDNGFNISDLNIPELYEPDIVSSFQNAEGWKPGEKVFVGDCMPYTYNGRYHVLYLKDRHHHQSKWVLGAHQWAHISTDDFNMWDVHPMAVEIDSPDEGSICTGSWIMKDGIHYLFYTVRTCDKSPRRILRSVSKDGYHFEKDNDFYCDISDRYTATTARDPKVVKSEDGRYHLFLTTSLKECSLGALAHFVSNDLDVWEEIPTPLYVAPDGMGEPECSDYFYKDGYYFLVYSLKATGYYMYSKKPFSDWKEPENPVIPCKSVPKAAIFNDKIIFAGYSGDGSYAGTMTFMQASVKENGELEFENLN